MALRRIIEPTTTPVSVAELADHLRANSLDETLLLERYIRAATDRLQDWEWRQYLAATYELTLDDWPEGDTIYLPRPPLTEVESVVYFDISGVVSEVSADEYFVDETSEPGRIVFKNSWPLVQLGRPAAVKITYVAGLETPEQLPDRTRQNVSVLAAHLYESREFDAPLPRLVKQLSRPFRDHRVMELA